MQYLLVIFKNMPEEIKDVFLNGVKNGRTGEILMVDEGWVEVLVDEVKVTVFVRGTTPTKPQVVLI